MIGEFIAFTAGYLVSWYSLLGLCLLGVLFEHGSFRGWSVFTGLLSMVVAFFFFKVPLAHIAIASGIYLVVGILWSFWRYKRHLSGKIATFKDLTEKELNGLVTQAYIRDLHPSKMIGAITAWILVWPFSFIENLVADILNFVETLVTKVFKGIYNKIYTSAIASLTPKAP